MEFDDGLILRRELIAGGFTDREIERARGRGELQAIRRGAMVQRVQMDNVDSIRQHRFAIEAAIAFAGSAAVVSHVSAAVVHGLSLWVPKLARVHLTIDAPSGGRTTSRRHVHATRLDASDVTLVDGISVTSVARTVVDCARTMPFEQAIVIGDSALHNTLVTPDELAAAVSDAACRSGVGAARRVVDFLDGRSESVGESRSRVLIHRAKLPKPDLQRKVFDASGREVGRVDFYWEEHHTIGEFDGLGKYRESTVPAEEVVIAEKLREDQLRSTGKSVARWTWELLSTPPEVVRRIEWAFDIGRRSDPRV